MQGMTPWEHRGTQSHHPDRGPHHNSSADASWPGWAELPTRFATHRKFVPLKPASLPHSSCWGATNTSPDRNDSSSRLTGHLRTVVLVGMPVMSSIEQTRQATNHNHSRMVEMNTATWQQQHEAEPSSITRNTAVARLRGGADTDARVPAHPVDYISSAGSRTLAGVPHLMMMVAMMHRFIINPAARAGVRHPSSMMHRERRRVAGG